MSLKNKRILITAGPTWVPIDDVRVLSNISSGETGILLAKEAKRQGAKVTLFLGPVSNNGLTGINLIRFKFFAELKNKLTRELRQRKYDVILHAAAVSDFQPAARIKGKLSSAKKYNLKLSPLPKIIKIIKKIASPAKIVLFKFEPGASKETLLVKGRAVLKNSGAQLVVANCLVPYRAFIIDKKSGVTQAKNKKQLAQKLIEALK